jgi:hypothetical protein
VQAPWTWAWDDHPSDLSGGVNFTRRMLHYVEPGPGEIEVDVAFDSTESDLFFSPANEPGASDWPVGTWRAQVDVTVPNARISLELGLARVNGAGVFQETYATASVPQLLDGAGIHVFSGATLPQTGATAGDRLRVLFRWTRDNSIGGGAGAGKVRFGYGDAAVDVLEVPILMANPRIVWNGNTLDFPGPLTGYANDPVAEGAQARSHGVTHATNLLASFRRLRIQLSRFQDIAFWDALPAWWSWAREGNPWAFAMDSADVVDKTMTGAAAAGQKDIPFTDTSSIVAGRKYWVRQATGHREEIVQVDTVTTNVKVTCLANLKFSYATGDVFRSRDYFPKVVSPPAPTPFEELAGVTYGFDHQCEEDRS